MNWDSVLDLWKMIDPATSGRLCLALLHSIWQVLLLALTVWALDRLCPNRTVRLNYALHVGALLAGLALLPVTYALVEVPVSLSTSATADNLATALPPPNSAVQSNQSAKRRASLPVSQEILQPLDAPIPQLANLPLVKEPLPAWIRFAPWCAGLYAAGVFVMLLRLLLGMRAAHRMTTNAQPILAGPLDESLQRLKQLWSLRALPLLKQSQEIVMPQVAGLLRPTILFPASALSGLSVDELEMILAHELAHVRRHDMWINLLQRVAEAVLFFNPALWYLSRRVSALREYCCDELACEAMRQNEVASNLRYAQALLHVVELRRGGASRQEIAALAASGRSPSELRRRVARLFGEPLREPIGLSRWGAFAVAAALMLLFVPLAQSQPNEHNDKPETHQRLVFPDDRTVGVVFRRPAENSGFGHKDNWYKDWEKVGPARGEVSVAADQHIRLDVSKSESVNLQFLGDLASDAIQYLNLQGTDVDDQQLAHIGKLTGLLMLNLEQTTITDQGFPPLASLQKLVRLDLSAFDVHSDGFGVGDEAMAVIAQLPALETVDLRLSQVTDYGMAELAKCKSLRSIGIEGTAVTDEGLKPLVTLPHLQILSLGIYREGAQITDEGMKTVGQMQGLESLGLSGTAVTDSGLAYLATASELKNLSLDNTKVTNSGLDHLQPLQRLETVRLHSGVNDEGAKHLSKLRNLKRISANLRVTDEGVRELAKLPQLEQLMLSSKRVTDASLEAIAQMPALKTLWFQDCGVSDDGFELLRNSPTLEYLLIHETDLSAAGLAHLQTLPNLRILDFDIVAILGEQPDWSILAQFQQLEILRIDGAAFGNDDLEHIKDLRQLKRLDLDPEYPIDDRGIAQLKQLTGLTNLRLEHSIVTDEGLQSLSAMDQVEYMTLSCMATDRGLTALKGMKSLRHLQIASPHVTDEGLDNLSQTMPSLQEINHYAYRLQGSAASVSSNDAFLRKGKPADRLAKDALEGKPAPQLSVEKWLNANGQAMSLADLHGKVVLVHFWNVGHHSSRERIPKLEQLYQKYHEQGLEIMGVHPAEKEDEMALFVADEGLEWPMAIDTENKTTSQWHDRYHSGHYLIDRNGNMRMADIHRGYLEEAIKTLLAEAAQEQKASNAEITHLQELVTSFESIYDKIEALHQVGAIGGSAVELALAKHSLAKARAELAQAQGNIDEAIRHYQAAVRAAEDNFQAQQAEYDAGRTPLSSLLEAGKLRAEAKLSLSRVQAAQVINKRAEKAKEKSDDLLTDFLRKVDSNRVTQNTVLGNRFLPLPVTTDLQRHLLGSVAKPDEEVSLCVFVNAGDFDSLDDINEQAAGCRALSKLLKQHAAKDSRRVQFRVLGGSRSKQNLTFEQQREKLDAIGKLVERLGKEAGFKGVGLSSTIGVDWDKSLGRARTTSANSRDADESATEVDKARVFQVKTFLSRFKTSANCVVDFMPVVRDADGVRFQADVLSAVEAAIGTLETDKGENLLVRVRYAQSAYQEINGWLKQQDNRQSYANKLGFKDCFVSMSRIAEPENAPNINAQDKKASADQHAMLIRVVDADGKPIGGAKVIQNQVLNTPQEARSTTIKNQNYLTDSNGEAVVEWTGESKDLRIWISKPNYVPLHAMWAKDLQTDGDQLPSEFQFEMEAGTEIGGVVTDEEGEPLEGVQVEIMDATATWYNLVRPNQPGLRPVPTTWLAHGDSAMVTDTQGRWTANNIPSASKLVFKEPSVHGTLRVPEGPPLRLRLSHPSYQTFDGAAFANRLQNPSLKDLRKKTASTILRASTPVAKVASDAGQTEESGSLGTELFPFHNATAAIPADDWPKTRQALEERKRELIQQLTLEKQFHLEEREVLRFISPDTDFAPLHKLRWLHSDEGKRTAWMHFHAMGDDLMIVQWTYGNDRTIADIFDGILGLRVQNIKGDTDVLDDQLLGDWVFRRDPRQPHIIDPKEVVVVANAISNELKEEYQLELKTVEQPVYVATGSYRFALASGPNAKVNRIDGPVAEKADGDFWVPARRRKYTGTVVHSFEDFLAVWGEVLLTPIVSEIETLPTKSDFFLRFANKPSTKLTEPLTKRTETQVLQYFTDQTGLTLKKETRPVQVLFVKKDET